MQTAKKSNSTNKVLPFSQEAEKGLLGVLMLQSKLWERVETAVVEEDFYDVKHKMIFKAIKTLQNKNLAVDMLTVVDMLNTLELTEKAGGEVYVYSIADQAPSGANITEYAKIIRDKALLRTLQSKATSIVDSVYHPDGREPHELVAQAEAAIFAIAQDRKKGTGPQPIADILTKTTEKIDQLYHSDGSMTGVASGFTDIDKMTSGLQPADLIIIAGRPSMGKTVLGINIAEHVAVSSKKPVCVFSLEMPSEAIVMRMLASLGRIKLPRVRTGKLQDDDWPRMTSAIGMLAQVPIFIDDTPGISPSDMRSKVRQLAREHGELGVVLVDYLQLMRVPEIRDNRVQEISEISRSLKMIAKEFNVPVIALSQLNRGLENRQDRRPIMSDLRESGAIEQDADIIAFIYRDEVYNPDTMEKGIAEINIGKHRNGPIGTVKLTFMGEYVRFDNFIDEVVM